MSLRLDPRSAVPLSAQAVDRLTLDVPQGSL